MSARTALPALALAAASLFPAAPASGAPPLVARLEASPTDPATLEAVARALERGRLAATHAADMARAISGPWVAPDTPAAVRQRIWWVLGQVLPPLALEDPALARRLCVETPLRWLREGTERTLAVEVLQAAATADPALAEAVADGAPALLEATLDPAAGEAALALLAGLPGEALARRLEPEAVARWARRLVEGRSPHVWRLPGLLGGIPGPAATAGLLVVVTRARELDPSLRPFGSAARLRADALRRLAGRRLTPAQLRRVADAAASASDEAERRAAVEVLARHEGPLPALPERLLDWLEMAVRDGDRPCGQAARLLESQGRRGALRLLAAWEAARAGRAKGCGWPLEEALRAAAPRIASELARLRARWPGDAFLAELAALAAAAGAPGAPPDPADLPPEARRRLAERLAQRLRERPDDREARETLRRLLDDDHAPVRATAWRALLALGDPAASWARLAEALRQAGAARARALETVAALGLPPAPAVLEALLAIAEGPAPARERVSALEAAWRSAREDTGPLASAEPRVRALLADPAPEVRRAAAYWFVAVPAREPATTEALIAALDDPSPYVRDHAAMALEVARAATPALLARLEERARRGDADPNVIRKMEAARRALERRLPAGLGAERLLAVLLGRAGGAAERRALLEAAPLEPETARALLAALAREPLDAWLDGLPERGGLGGDGLARLVEAERDPPPWVLLAHLVPRPLLDGWLVRQAARPERTWEERVRLLALVGRPRDAADRERLRELVVEALRSGALDEARAAALVGRLLAALDYGGVRALVEGLWDQPRALARAELLLRRIEWQAGLRAAMGAPGGGLPAPGAADAPWIARWLRRIAPGRGDPRLAPFVRISRLHELGASGTLRRAARQAGLVALLRRHLPYRRECEAVRHALGALLGTVLPPACAR